MSSKTNRVPNTYLDYRKAGLITGINQIDPSSTHIICVGEGNVVGPSCSNVIILGNHYYTGSCDYGFSRASLPTA